MGGHDLSYDEAHRIAREQPVKGWMYAAFRMLVGPLSRVFFGLRVSGVGNLPVSGAAVLVPNHKSYFDGPFLVAASPRPLRAMGKAELFQGRHGRLLLAIGGFPVRRGESDAAAVETARLLLARGELVAVFPEGTRVRDPDALGVPKRGAVRLALDTGSPIIPVAITGLEKRRVPLPRRVRVTFGEPISVVDVEMTPEAAGVLLEQVVWPTLEADYRRVRATPGLIATAVAGIGLAVVLHQRRKH
jgi:1-acyl-sn-glycerol-3-phosphate acyltransferase